MTRSNCFSSAGSNSAALRCSASMMEMPSRAAFFSIREILCACRSQDRMLPVFSICMAAAKLLPPGAAQQSSTRMPGAAPDASTASFRGGILYTDRPRLEQRQRLKITRTGDEEASMQPRVRLIGDPRFVQRGSDLFRCGFQGIYLQRSLRNIIIGGEERFERFVIHRRAQTVNKRLRVRILCGQDHAAGSVRPFCGRGCAVSRSPDRQRVCSHRSSSVRPLH